jgi:phytoene dehydrogenase-like protein
MVPIPFAFAVGCKCRQRYRKAPSFFSLHLGVKADVLKGEEDCHHIILEDWARCGHQFFCSWLSKAIGLVAIGREMLLCSGQSWAAVLSFFPFGLLLCAYLMRTQGAHGMNAAYRMEDAHGTLFVSLPSVLDPSVAPAGQHVVHAFTPDWIDDWKGLPPDVYEERKEMLAEALIDRLDALWPGLKAGIELREVWTYCWT